MTWRKFLIAYDYRSMDCIQVLFPSIKTISHLHVDIHGNYYGGTFVDAGDGWGGKLLVQLFSSFTSAFSSHVNSSAEKIFNKNPWPTSYICNNMIPSIILTNYTIFILWDDFRKTLKVFTENIHNIYYAICIYKHILQYFYLFMIFHLFTSYLSVHLLYKYKILYLYKI